MQGKTTILTPQTVMTEKGKARWIRTTERGKTAAGIKVSSNDDSSCLRGKRRLFNTYEYNRNSTFQAADRIRPHRAISLRPSSSSLPISKRVSGIRSCLVLPDRGRPSPWPTSSLRVNRPALVLAPNKTLAAQLYNEFRALFPENAVEYFVSYYDYYQPEAYVPASDTYIEKDSAINDDIDKLRHAATHALLTRRDVIIVASVSCIYGLGSPEYYARLIIPVEVGQRVSMDAIITKLVDVQYQRNDMDFHRGTFRVRGDVLEVIPAYEHERALRLEFFGDEIEGVREIDPLTGEILGNIGKTVIYPASHYVSDRDNLERAMSDVRDELGERAAPVPVPEQAG